MEAEIYGPINDRQRETVGRVRMSRRHLLSLLDNVMEMARLDAGVVHVAAEHDGSIAVTTAERECDGVRWGEVRVTDTGPGIAEAERRAIFEPYYRSEAAVGEPGVGLGLAISHGLVQQMGGVIEIESEVGSGTTFIVRLPLAAKPA